MLKNQDLAHQLLTMTETLIEASELLHQYTAEHNHDNFRTLSGDMYDMLTAILEAAPPLDAEEDGLHLSAAAASIRDSLMRISYYEQHFPEKAVHKIEYEFIPLTEMMLISIYYWGCVYPDREKTDCYNQDERHKLGQNVYLARAQETGDYLYDLSVVVMAYNKLEYTKMCVESLIRFIPKDLKYELILVNHGSSDGTKEYFESVHPDKQLDISINGGGFGALERIHEGKYTLFVSNDVLVTPHAIENMLRCIESDESIAWVVPATANICNYQTLPLQYNTIDDLWEAAEKNNVSDPFRWEQRSRLCNPIELRKNSIFEKTKPKYYGYGNKITFAFNDDMTSLLLRRDCYKMVLAKDAYCHHFGSVTLKEEFRTYGESEAYLEGRRCFYEEFYVDPWGKGMCYDRFLFNKLPCDKTDSVIILGINSGLGSNPLKIKESLKENVHNLDCKIYSYTSEPEFIKDLEGVSEEAYQFADWESFEPCRQANGFDYILIESGLENEKDYQNILRNITGYLNQDGYMIVKFANEQNICWIKTNYNNVVETESDTEDGHWLFWKMERQN